MSDAIKSELPQHPYTHTHMSQTSLLKGLGVLGALFLASCASTPEMTRVPMAAHSPSSSGSASSGELHAKINSYRASIGKRPLQRHSGLDKLAYEHCRFMAANKGKFTMGSSTISHYGSEERALKARHTYGVGNMAENIAGGVIPTNVSSRLLDSWVKSRDHHSNLKQDWDATGVGVYRAPDGTVYATQLFATIPPKSHMALMDRINGF